MKFAVIRQTQDNRVYSQNYHSKLLFKLWAKNMPEIFVVIYTSIWPNIILIVIRIQKN